ncbi:hypothetical protein B296_00040784, partial [Ensete ventricosum]
SDFAIGLASGSGKLRGLRRHEAVAPLHRAGFPGLGPLVTPFAGVPPGEPIGSGQCSVPESPNGRSGDMGPPSSANNVRGEFGVCLVDAFRFRVC